MKNSLPAVENRVKSAVNSYNSILLLRQEGPLIDPDNCKIINECRLDSEIVSKYEQHILAMRNYFNQKASFLKLYLNSIGIFGDIFETSITIGACIEYVAATYLENDYKSLFSILDVMIATIFFVDWMIHLVVSDKRLEFLVSYSSFIDYLTIIPVYLEIFGNSFSVKVSFFRVLRVFRSLRILRLFKTLEVIIEEEDDNNKLKYTVDTSGISKQIVTTSITLLSVLFISAGVVNAINDLVEDAYYYPPGSTFDFLAAFYYMIVTSSTLGYGDIYPLVTISRMATVVIIFFIIFIITNQVTKISQLMENYSKYDTQYHFKNHLVIAGNYRSRTLIQFLAQFYHSDHGEVKTPSIIIGSKYPSSDIIGILNDPRYEGRIYYLEGNPSYSTTWRNANIELAESVFILTDQLNQNLKLQDTYAVLLARMIQAQCPLIQTYVQLIRPLEYSMISEDSTWNTIVSLQTIKLSLLGTSIHNTGFSTLMGGLYLAFGSLTQMNDSQDWMKTFTYGLGQEIYSVRISEFFIGMAFNQVVDIIYSNCKGILTLGVKSLIGMSSKHEILVNPVGYNMQRDDFLFVITSDQNTADLITQYNDNLDYKSIKVSSYAQIALAHNFQTVKIQAKEYFCELKPHSVFDLAQDDLNGRVSKHVLIFGGLEGFEILINALRVYSEQPICLVNYADPGSQWEKFARFENIYYLKGNVMDFQDLYNTGIKDCYSVLILSNLTTNSLSPDSEVVLLTKLIEYSFPSTKIIVELINKSYIRFLGSRPSDGLAKLSYNHWPNSISGKVFFSSNLDSFICQAYYNKDLLDVILRVMGITKSKNLSSKLIENSNIRTIKIPKFYFEDQSEPLQYIEILKDLLHLNPPVIPLGVLSAGHTVSIVEKHSNDEMGQAQHIVFTNPPPDTLIGIDDKIICLGEPSHEIAPDTGLEEQKERGLNSEGILKMGIADLLIKTKNLNLNNKIESEVKEEDESIGFLFDLMKKRMQNLGKLQKDIDRKSKLIGELQKEADFMKEKLVARHNG